MLPALLFTLASLFSAAPSPAAEHVFVFIRTGPTRVSGEAASAAMAGHFDSMGHLAGQGHLALAGPFGEPRHDPSDRGLWIFAAAGVSAAAPFAHSDPCVEMGVFELELVPFRTDWPLDVIGPLVQIAGMREPGDDGGMSGFVIATREGLAPAELEPAIAAEDIVLAGKFGGDRAGTQLIVLDAQGVDAARELLAQHALEPDAWTLRPWWGTALLRELPRLRRAALDARVDLEPRTLDAASGLPALLTKSVDVFGVPVFATAATDDAALKHAATILAEYLDNDEDGRMDDPRLVLGLHEARAALLVRPADDAPITATAMRSAGFLFAPELIAEDVAQRARPHEPGAATFDAAVRGGAELVAFGALLAYPGVFGVDEGCALASALDVATGEWFQPASAATPEERGRAYFAWALTSNLGLEAQPERQREIAARWKLATPELLRAGDPAIAALLTARRFGLPRLGPDGSYR
ncbi:MAG: hypothetical protein WD226_04765 [Planctomycetota bacterium]